MFDKVLANQLFACLCSLAADEAKTIRLIAAVIGIEGRFDKKKRGRVCLPLFLRSERILSSTDLAESYCCLTPS